MITRDRTELFISIVSKKADNHDAFVEEVMFGLNLVYAEAIIETLNQLASAVENDPSIDVVEFCREQADGLESITTSAIVMKDLKNKIEAAEAAGAAEAEADDDSFEVRDNAQVEGVNYAEIDLSDLSGLLGPGAGAEAAR